jgi:undecaprenyl-diphosphatase
MLSVRTPFFVQLFKGVTFFGNPATIIGMAIVVMCFLAYRRYWSYLAGFVVALGGAAASAYVLKEVVARARPGELIQTVAETGYSFPSGHATGSMAFYGFIAFILYRLYPRCQKSVFVVAALVILAIGFSRLYLGVHFPSDVIAGYLVGGLYVWAGILVVRKGEA